MKFSRQCFHISKRFQVPQNTRSAGQRISSTLLGVWEYIKTLLLAFDIILSTPYQKLLTLDVYVSLVLTIYFLGYFY